MDLSPEERERIYQEELAKRHPPSDKTSLAKTSNSRSGWFWLVGFSVFVAVCLSFLHIVWNVPSGVLVFAKREPALADTFVNFDSLTGIPKIILLAQHASVVKGLEERGQIRWESSGDKPRPNGVGASYGTTPPSAPVDPPVETGPVLKLLSAKAVRDDYSLTINGQVKNISSRSLKGVQAVVEFYDKKKTLVTSQDAFIEYDPIMPDQASPFKVVISDNPAVKDWVLNFKQYLGGTLECTWPKNK